MAQTRTKYDRFPFSTLFQFVVIKALDLAGEKFQPGDVIDRTDVNDDRLLRKLYDGRFTEVRADDESNPVIVGTAEKPRQPAPEVPADAEHQPGAAGGTGGDIGGGLTAKHEGFGKWFVYAGDVKVSGPHTKEEAQNKAGVKPA